MLRVDKDNQMLIVDDENGDLGAYLEYPRDSDTSNQEPLILESS